MSAGRSVVIDCLPDSVRRYREGYAIVAIDVIRATTVAPAMAIRRPELGSLKAGSAGDATVLSLKEGTFDYVDVVEEHMTGDRKLFSEGVVLGGRWWHGS